MSRGTAGHLCAESIANSGHGDGIVQELIMKIHPRPRRLMITVVILIMILIFIIVKRHLSVSISQTIYSLEEVSIDTLTRKLNINWKYDDDTVMFSADIALNMPSSAKVFEEVCQERGQGKCLTWEGKAKQRITKNHRVNSVGPDCYTVEWVSLSKDFSPMDCIKVGTARWYGGASLFHQRWPIEQTTVRMQPYIANDVGTSKLEGNKEVHGAVLERYWLNSAGVAIYVADNVPLHVSIDNKKLCLKAQYENSPFSNARHILPVLNYTVCISEDVQSMHRQMASRLWKKPTGLPDINMFRDPIWSTWVKFKDKITQEHVLKFAEDIKSYGFSASQIEIDDHYCRSYGDYDFDPVKFPDPTTMIQKIHDLGYRVTSWVTPFANMDSAAFTYGMQKGYWLKVDGAYHQVPGLVRWWRGLGSILDITNDDAVQWFFQGDDMRLKNLLDIGVDSFKFDAGETDYLPLHPQPNKSFPHGNPAYYSTRYAEACVKHAAPMLEVRVGYKSQHLPVFIRVYDKYSDWSYVNGLRTVIPSVLTFSILGYPFVLPDMIGGNGYTADKDALLPDKELYIRWLGVNVFLPGIQFSLTPWQYDAQTVLIALKLLKLREEYVVPKLLKLAEECVLTGDPIIRPMWWIDPKNPETFDIDSQFMLGDDVLVAPILEQGSKGRSIYLPNGQWKDMLRETKYEGNRLIVNYSAQLEEVPYFEKLR